MSDEPRCCTSYENYEDEEEIRGWEIADTGMITNDPDRIEKLYEAGVELRSLVYGSVIRHKKDVCPTCRGTGSGPFPTRQICSKCKGTGKKNENVR